MQPSKQKEVISDAQQVDLEYENSEQTMDRI